MRAKVRAATRERTEEILDAAQAVFGEQGYSAASMDEIARVARASKSTLYNLFGDKETLFRTLMERRLADPERPPLRPDMDEPPEVVLHRIALGTLRGVTSPQAAALVRMAIAETARFPKLKRLMAEGLRYDVLATYLDACRRKGLMAFDDADRAAVMFVHMAQADWTVRALYGLLDPPPRQEDLEAHATLAARMFLAAVAPKA